jgi:hypothetical protein
MIEEDVSRITKPIRRPLRFYLQHAYAMSLVGLQMRKKRGFVERCGWGLLNGVGYRSGRLYYMQPAYPMSSASRPHLWGPAAGQAGFTSPIECLAGEYPGRDKSHSRSRHDLTSST